MKLDLFMRDWASTRAQNKRKRRKAGPRSPATKQTGNQNLQTAYAALDFPLAQRNSRSWCPGMLNSPPQKRKKEKTARARTPRARGRPRRKSCQTEGRFCTRGTWL